MLMYIRSRTIMYWVWPLRKVEIANPRAPSCIHTHTHTHTHKTYMHVNTHILIDILKCNLGILEVQEHSCLRKRYAVRLKNTTQK